MARPDEIILLKQGLEHLGKALLQGKGGSLKRGEYQKISRAVTAAIPQQDDLFTSHLGQVPNALQQADLGDFTKARKVLGSISTKESTFRKKVNWGPDNEAHHTLELIGQYLVAGKLSMRQAQDFYRLAQQEGIPLGTLRQHLRSVTQPGHLVAHTNIRTNRQGTKGSSEQTAALIDAQKPKGNDERLELWLPETQKEIQNSLEGVSTKEEQQVINEVARLTGINPSEFEHSKLILPAQDAKRGSDVTRAQRIKGIVETTLTKEGVNLQDLARDIYSQGNAEIAIPMMKLETPTRGVNKGIQRAVLISDPSPGLMAKSINEQRPEEEQLLNLLRKPLGH